MKKSLNLTPKSKKTIIFSKKIPVIIPKMTNPRSVALNKSIKNSSS